MIFFELPIYDYSTLVNSIGIFLEIGGFFFTFRVVRRIMRGGFIETGFIETGSITDHPETQIVSNPNPRIFLLGVGLVIAGLFCQFLAQGIRGSW